MTFGFEKLPNRNQHCKSTAEVKIGYMKISTRKLHVQGSKYVI